MKISDQNEEIVGTNGLQILRHVFAFPLNGKNVLFASKRRRPFPFRKRSVPFLTVDAIIGDQAFSRYRCNIFPGLSYNKESDTFLNSLKKNDVEAQVTFTSKVMETARVTCY